MRSLFLIRHAKAWKAGGEPMPDIRRPLLPEGITEAEESARNFQSANIPVDLMLSSPAVRALETARIFAQILKYPAQDIILKKELYGNSPAEIFCGILRQLLPETERVLVFGHNPDISDWAAYLLPGFDHLLPTSGIVEIKFGNKAWPEVVQNSGELGFSRMA